MLSSKFVLPGCGLLALIALTLAFQNCGRSVGKVATNAPGQASAPSGTLFDTQEPIPESLRSMAVSGAVSGNAAAAVAGSVQLYTFVSWSLENQQNHLRGWACVQDSAAPVKVVLFAGTPNGNPVATVVADRTMDVGGTGLNLCGGEPMTKHGFDLALDAKTSNAIFGQDLFVYALSPNGQTMAGGKQLFHIPSILPAPLNYMFRAYNPGSGEHMSTISNTELLNSGWQYEPVHHNAYAIQVDGTHLIYRCFTGGSPGHFVSTDKNCEGQHNEGAYGWVYDQPNSFSKALYRLYSPSRNDHLVSSDPNEGAQAGYINEGLLGYQPLERDNGDN